MTDKERLKASASQMRTYGSSQYSMWRIVVIRSIKKILLNLDSFYDGLLDDFPENGVDEVHQSIRNGWFYEAVAQCEQAIEDLFSTMMNSSDPAYFAKNVVNYSAAKVKKYIWEFKTGDFEYIAKQFHIPYFPLDEEWEHKDVFEAYKNGMCLISKYLEELQKFHKKYYLDYCQYKHGMSVGLTPNGNKLKIEDLETRQKIMSRPLENGLFTFHNEPIEKYQEKTGELPAPMLWLTPDTHKFLNALHDEGNLLYSTVHHVDMEEVEEVAKKSCILLDALWVTLINESEREETDKFHEVAIPIDELGKYYVIGFPLDEE